MRGSDDRSHVSAVVEARREVLKIFDVPADEAYSLNELSHLVYDPFPARFSVSLPSEAREALEEKLCPAPLYRVVFTLGGDPAKSAIGAKPDGPDDSVVDSPARGSRRESP